MVSKDSKAGGRDMFEGIIPAFNCKNSEKSRKTQSVGNTTKNRLIMFFNGRVIT
jgi:hypothetical protein